MIEKRIIEVFIVLVFLVLIVVIDRKKVVYLLILILPFSLSSRFGEINIYLILLIYIMMFMRDLGGGKQRYRDLAIPIFLSLFVFSYILSFIYNQSSLEFPNGLLQSPYFISITSLASCIALFLMVTKHLDTVEDVQTVIKFIIAAYLLMSIASVLQIINPSKLYIFEHFTHYQSRAEQAGRGGVRVYGTLGEYELYAEYSAIVLLLLFYSILEMSQKAWKKIFYGGTVIVVLFLLLMSKTRGPLVALALVLCYLTFINGRKIGVGRNLVLGTVIAAIVAVVYAVMSANSEYNVIDHLFSTEIDVKKGTFDTRSATWQYGIERYISTGIVNKFIGLGPGIVSHTPQLLVFPHSLYLYLLISLGAFGFLIYMAWFVWLFKGPNNKVNRSVLILSIFLKAVLLLFIIDEFKIEYLRNPTYQQMIWVIFGLLYVVNKKIQPVNNSQNVSSQKAQSKRLLS